uniref:Uncharacterized protein n=1 Tax=Wuchereria bancrofti TaxID=6293 RepID=A0AAF5PPE9_WUCBA
MASLVAYDNLIQSFSRLSMRKTNRKVIRIRSQRSMPALDDEEIACSQIESIMNISSMPIATVNKILFKFKGIS